MTMTTVNETMSDDATPTSTQLDPAQQTEGDTMPSEEETTAEEETDQTEGPGREAAKYRRQLRATEKERDGLAGQLETLQRQVIETTAANVLAEPEDLWLFNELPALLDEAGNVDPAAVDAAARKVASERPGLAVPTIDLGQGARTRTPTGTKSWSDALSPHR